MNGWLSPKAKFYPCPIGKHFVKAQQLIKLGDKVGGETWVAVHPEGAFTELPLTEAQIKWLKDSLQKNKDEVYQDMVELLLEKQDSWGKLERFTK